jgi:hypothetical protein
MGSFMTCTLYNDQVKEEDMGKACSTHGDKKSACRMSVAKRERKRALGRRKCRREENIKVALRDRMRWYGHDCSGSGEHGNEHSGSI